MNVLERIWKGASAWLDRWPLTGVLLVLLSFNYVSSRFIGNEEHYLQLAKFFMDPSWVPGSFLLSDYTAHRWFFMVVVGQLIEWFGFHWAAALGRLALLFIMVPALVRIFKNFPLSNAQWVIVFQLVLLTNQSFFGQEWIFLAFEPKTLAYAALLWALVFFQRESWLPMAFLLGVATYFHILVGFGTSLAFFGVQFLHQYRSRAFWLSGVAWMMMTIPFIAWVQSGLTPPTGLEPSEDWIYTHFRNPHHTALFADMEIFFKAYLPGIVLSLLLGAYLVMNYDRIEAYKRSMKQLVIFCLGVSLLFVVVGYFDSDGRIMKYYPFRLQVWGVFFGLPIPLYHLIRRISSKQWSQAVLAILLIAALVSMTKSFTDQFFPLNGRVPDEKQEAYIEVMDFINSSFPEKGEVFLFYTPGKTVAKFDYTNFSRLTRQERFVSFKFVPTTSDKLRIWYDRLNRKEALYESRENLTESGILEEVDYIISTVDLTDLLGEPMFSNEKYYLYGS